jgi:type IV pilus secretin PilQ/predicted competence protein
VFDPLRTSARCLRVLACSLLALTLAGTACAAAATRTISLDAEDAYIPSVLKILAEKGGLNIITGPGVNNDRISIHMKDVPVDQAVNLVVRAAGLAYERIGNSILVADAKSLKEETGLSSYVIELKYADAYEVKAALINLEQAIQVDKSGNRLIIMTSPRVISEVEKVVEIMDQPVQQVMLEARIVEVSTDDLKVLGIDWDLLNRQGVLIVEGGPNNAVPPATGYVPPPGTAPGVPPGTVPFVPLHNVFENWTRQARVFQATLDMLIRNGNGRVLANPRVATLNGREASMIVGQRIPYETSQTVFAGGAAAPTLSVQREEVGIKLRITPLINADGYITTTIEPEVSSVVAFVGRNNDLPVVSTRQTSTTVRLKDGNSVIIGGLLSEETSRNVTKVPLLGDIPGIGLLFQHHRNSVSKKDLVIEVTPHIMPPQK